MKRRKWLLGWMNTVWLMIVLVPQVHGQIQIWTRTAGPHGGSVGLIEKTTTGTLLGSAGPDLFRSVDGGDTWQVVLEAGRVYSLDTEEPLTLFTADTTYQSLDDGQTWEPAPVGPAGVRTYRLVRSGQTGWFARTDDGAYRSQDEGQTWEEVRDGLGSNVVARLASIAVAPDGTVYVGTTPICCFGLDSAIYAWNEAESRWVQTGENIGGVIHDIVFDATGKGYAVATSISLYGGGGFFRAPEGGAWEKVPTMGEVLALHVQPDGDLLIGTSSGILQSEDEGTTQIGLGPDYYAVWDVVVSDTGDLFAGTGTYCFPAIDYPYCLPGGGLFRKKAGSETWEPLTLTSAMSEVRGLAPARDGGILALAVDGLWHSSNGGASWLKQDQAGQTYAFPYFYNYASSGLIEAPWGEVYAGSQLRHLMRFEAGIIAPEGEGEWSQLGVFVDGQTVAALDDGVVVGGSFEGIERSTDRGQTWETVLSASKR